MQEPRQGWGTLQGIKAVGVEGREPAAGKQDRKGRVLAEDRGFTQGLQWGCFANISVKGQAVTKEPCP